MTYHERVLPSSRGITFNKHQAQPENPSSLLYFPPQETRERFKREGVKIVIIGGGIVGNSLALQLADKGFHPTIVSKTGLISEDTSIRRSTPVIRQKTADMLTIPFNTEQAACQFRRAGGGRIVNNIIEGIALRRLQQNPLIAIDIEKTEKELHARTASNPNIAIVSGSFIDAEIQEDKVTGVVVREGDDERILHADLVIDTTGKIASVAKRVESKRPGSIQETRSNQPTAIVGGYIAFKAEGIEKIYPTLERVMYAGILLNNLNTICLYPATKDQDSQATHLILVGGDHVAMQETYRMAKEKAGKDADILQIRLAMLDILTQGSPWNSLIRNITHIDRTVFSQHIDSVKLYVKDVKGLVLIGDAVEHMNPIYPLGLSHAAQDVTRFVEKLETVTTKDHVDELIGQYNEEQGVATDRRLKSSEKLYSRAHRFVQAYQAVGRVLKKELI